MEVTEALPYVGTQFVEIFALVQSVSHLCKDIMLNPDHAASLSSMLHEKLVQIIAFPPVPFEFDDYKCIIGMVLDVIRCPQLPSATYTAASGFLKRIYRQAPQLKADAFNVLMNLKKTAPEDGLTALASSLREYVVPSRIAIKLYYEMFVQCMQSNYQSAAATPLGRLAVCMTEYIRTVEWIPEGYFENLLVVSKRPGKVISPKDLATGFMPFIERGTVAERSENLLQILEMPIGRFFPVLVSIVSQKSTADPILLPSSHEILTDRIINVSREADLRPALAKAAREFVRILYEKEKSTADAIMEVALAFDFSVMRVMPPNRCRHVIDDYTKPPTARIAALRCMIDQRCKVDERQCTSIIGLVGSNVLNVTDLQHISNQLAANLEKMGDWDSVVMKLVSVLIERGAREDTDVVIDALRPILVSLEAKRDKFHELWEKVLFDMLAVFRQQFGELSSHVTSGSSMREGLVSRLIVLANTVPMLAKLPDIPNFKQGFNMNFVYHGIMDCFVRGRDFCCEELASPLELFAADPELVEVWLRFQNKKEIEKELETIMLDSPPGMGPLRVLGKLWISINQQSASKKQSSKVKGAMERVMCLIGAACIRSMSDPYALALFSHYCQVFAMFPSIPAGPRMKVLNVIEKMLWIGARLQAFTVYSTPAKFELPAGVIDAVKRIASGKTLEEAGIVLESVGESYMPDVRIPIILDKTLLQISELMPPDDLSFIRASMYRLNEVATQLMDFTGAKVDLVTRSTFSARISNVLLSTAVTNRGNQTSSSLARCLPRIWATSAANETLEYMRELVRYMLDTIYRGEAFTVVRRSLGLPHIVLIACEISLSVKSSNDETKQWIVDAFKRFADMLGPELSDSSSSLFKEKWRYPPVPITWLCPVDNQPIYICNDRSVKGRLYHRHVHVLNILSLLILSSQVGPLVLKHTGNIMGLFVQRLSDFLDQSDWTLRSAALRCAAALYQRMCNTTAEVPSGQPVLPVAEAGRRQPLDTINPDILRHMDRRLGEEDYGRFELWATTLLSHCQVDRDDDMAQSLRDNLVVKLPSPNWQIRMQAAKALAAIMPVYSTINQSVRDILDLIGTGCDNSRHGCAACLRILVLTDPSWRKPLYDTLVGLLAKDKHPIVRAELLYAIACCGYRVDDSIVDEVCHNIELSGDPLHNASIQILLHASRLVPFTKNIEERVADALRKLPVEDAKIICAYMMSEISFSHEHNYDDSQRNAANGILWGCDAFSSSLSEEAGSARTYMSSRLKEFSF